MAGLAEKTCVPCRGGVPPLTSEQIKPLAAQVENWHVVNNHHIEKEFKFHDFKTALDFTNKVAPSRKSRPTIRTSIWRGARSK